MVLKKKLFFVNYVLIILFFLIIMSFLNAQVKKDIVSKNNIGVAYMGQFNFIKAQKIFSELVKDNPSNLELKINLAIATLNRQEKGDERVALSILKDVLTKDKNNLHALYCSGLLELYLGNPEKALVYFSSVRQKASEDPEVLYFIGKTLIQLSRYEESIIFFNKTISLDEYMSSAYYGLVLAYRQLGKRDIALEKIKEFQKIKNNPRVRSLEFKYTKMGKKGEVIVINKNKEHLSKKPAGSIFEKGERILSEANINWIKKNDLKKEQIQSITVADINNDNILDVFISGAVRASGITTNAVLIKDPKTNKYKIDPSHPLANISDVNTVLWADINNDLITDVYICRNGKNQLWQQDNKGNWSNISVKSKIENGNFNTVDGLLFDADHDGDLDIFLINDDGPNELLNNNRDGEFRPLADNYGLKGSAVNSRSLIVADLDNDRDTDIIVINRNAPHEVYINDRLWKYHLGKGFEEFNKSDICAAVSGDLNANGNIEIYTLSSMGKISVWEKDFNGIWGHKEIINIKKKNIINKISLEDVNGDGSIDLIYSDNTGIKALSLNQKEKKVLWTSEIYPSKFNVWTMINSMNGPSIIGLGAGNSPLLLRPGPGRYKYIQIELSGTKKDAISWRSNSSGIGTKLSARNGSNWTVLNTFKNSSGAGQSLQPLMVGLKNSKSIDFIAIDWSDGVFQTELNLAGGKTHKVFETQRQLSSCPVLFAWNGKKVEFVSDLLGVGGMGYAVAPGEYAPPRPWENYLFPEGSIKSINGTYIIKLTEPMEEATYFDSVKLITYDLPSGWKMSLDERMGISDPMPTGKEIFYKEVLNPVSAKNERNELVTETILSRDLKAAPVGTLDKRFVGMLENDHVLTIEFSESLDHYQGQAVLIIDGWVEYPYSQTNFAAWQAGAFYKAPSIEIENSDGSWTILLEQFGYPAGMPRQMSVPLGGDLKGVRRIRISTNQEIYWDKIIVGFAQECPDLIKNELKIKMAILEEIGFPKREDRAQHLPYYDYADRKPLWDTHFLEGNYTKIGRVDDLVNTRDNALAIFGSGEGISIEFLEPELPLKSGWKRHFVLETHGWCKDMDLYTKDNDTLAPIPSKGKTGPIAKKLQKTYNNRYLNGKQ